jgi:hypothetical protein
MYGVDFWTLVFFVFAVALLALTGLLIRSIRLEAPGLWRQLGSPSIMRLEGASSIYKFWRWVFRTPGVESLSQKVLTLLITLRIATAMYLVAFVLMAARVIVQ